MSQVRDSVQSRSVDIHYRCLDRDDENFPEHLSLAEALRRALRSIVGSVRLEDDVRERVQNEIPSKPGDIRCWNNIAAADGFVFGTLCLYRPSELQAVIRARDIPRHISAFPLDQIGDAQGRDFLKAIAYWMAVDDHFYLIQTPSIQTGAIEDYQNWLLRKAGVIEQDQRVRLRVALDRDAVGGDLDDLVSVNVGGAFEPPAAAGEEATAEAFRPGPLELRPVSQVVLERQRLGRRPIIGNAWDLMHQLFNDQRTLEEIEDAYRHLRAADPTATLDVEVEFVVHTKKHRDNAAQTAKQRALRAISDGLRDMPEGAVTARGKDGTVKGREIRLKAPRRINLAPPPDRAPVGAHSHLLDLDHVFREMRVVHQRFLDDGKI